MKGAALAKALASPDPAVRCYLFYGVDEAGSRALANRLAAAFGNDAERVDLTPAQLRADPALLADEAASASLFGNGRYIRVDGAGDECMTAVEGLLGASAAGNPVILVAGALRKDARLVKRLDGDRAGIVAASFVPEGADAARMAKEIARGVGLTIDDEMARGLAETVGGDRAILTAELTKIALYADADPTRPVRLTAAMVDAVGAGTGEADLGRIVTAVFGGDIMALDRELAGLTEPEAVGVVRALTRRALAMAMVRGEVDRGAAAGPATVKAGVFWKERDAVAHDVGRWTAPRLAMAIDRLGAIERALKSGRGAPDAEMRQSLVAMARSVGRH